MATYTLTNLIPEASSKFSSGGNNGTYDSTYTFHGSTSLKLTGTISTDEILAQLDTTVAQIQNHYYYGRIYEYHTDSALSDKAWQIYWPIDEPAFNFTQFGLENRGNLLGAVNIRSKWASGSPNLRIDFDNRKIAGSVGYDGLMLIDLTACFGSGNEPTVDGCNTYIPYFTGTLTYSVSPLKLRIKYNDSYIINDLDISSTTKTLSCNSNVMASDIQLEIYGEE